MITEPQHLVDYLTKREHIATQILTGTVTIGLSEYEMAKLADNAVKLADKLIFALNLDQQ